MSNELLVHSKKCLSLHHELKRVKRALLITNNQSGIAVIVIIAAVIILLAFLATILKFSLSGSDNKPKPSPSDMTQATPKPSSSTIAHASLATSSPGQPEADSCDNTCVQDFNFDGEGDGIKATDLDGEES